MSQPKEQRLTEWMQKQDLYIYCPQETHIRLRETYKLKVREWKKLLHTNEYQKKCGLAVFLSGQRTLK